MVTYETAERMSNEEASAFAKKLEDFERSLTAKERRMFQEVLTQFAPTNPVDDITDEALTWAGDAE